MLTLRLTAHGVRFQHITDVMLVLLGIPRKCQGKFNARTGVIVAIAVALAVTALSFAVRDLVDSGRSTPSEEALLSSIDTYLSARNCRLFQEVRNVATRCDPPRLVSLWRRLIDVGKSEVRLGGVGVPYEHGEIREYTSGLNGSIQVAVDIRAGMAYHVTLIGATNAAQLFLDLSRSLQTFGIPVTLELR